MAARLICPECGQPCELVPVTRPKDTKAPHRWATAKRRLTCSQCGRELKWVPKPGGTRRLIVWNLGLFLVVVPLIIVTVPDRWGLAVAAAVGYVVNFLVVSRSQELKKAESSADGG